MDKCEHCNYATVVSANQVYCVFANCPYEKHPDPFGEVRAEMDAPNGDASEKNEDDQAIREGAARTRKKRKSPVKEKGHSA